SAENVLGKMRDGVLAASPTTISPVLEAVDEIKFLLHGLESTGKEPNRDNTDLIRRLDSIAENIGALEEAPAEVESEPVAVAPAAVPVVSSAPAPVAAAVATVAQRAEPGLSVSYTPAEEDALAAEFDEPGTAPGEDITSELEELFDSTDTTIQKRLAAEKTVAARTLVPDPEGYAPPDVDFLVGDATAEQPIPPGSTVEQPRPNLEPTVDLRTLASSATGDEQQAQTLLEALTLLERDYEEELTASQVLDMSAVREALGEDFDEPTQVREARLKDAASGKKKS
ncbi:MAG: hypothetical protein J0M16_01680, partial [Gammaproteobacteria bacterium]|nr:hypothetical protein [Gammaproteobacteria bacterium]